MRDWRGKHWETDQIVIHFTMVQKETSLWVVFH